MMEKPVDKMTGYAPKMITIDAREFAAMEQELSELREATKKQPAYQWEGIKTHENYSLILAQLRMGKRFLAEDGAYVFMYDKRGVYYNRQPTLIISWEHVVEAVLKPHTGWRVTSDYVATT